MVIETPSESWRSERLWVGTWRNLVIQCWDTAAKTDDLEAATRVMLEHAKRFPDGVVTLAFLRANGVPSMGDAERKRAAELLQASTSSMRVGVQVVEGTGFVASFLRSVIAGLSRFSKAPMRVFATQSEAVQFIVDQRHTTATLADLTRAVDDVHARWRRPS